MWLITYIFSNVLKLAGLVSVMSNAYGNYYFYRQSQLRIKDKIKYKTKYKEL